LTGIAVLSDQIMALLRTPQNYDKITGLQIEELVASEPAGFVKANTDISGQLVSRVAVVTIVLSGCR
jgi:hypothetical protein